MSEEKVEYQHPLMHTKLIDYIADFFMGNAAWLIYKTFASGKSLDKQFWDDNLSDSIVLLVEEGSIDKTMLIFQVREATDAGLLEHNNMAEDDEDEWEQMKSMGMIVFTITERGRDYIMPYITNKLVEHFEGIIDKIKEL